MLLLNLLITFATLRPGTHGLSYLRELLRKACIKFKQHLMKINFNMQRQLSFFTQLKTNQCLFLLICLVLVNQFILLFIIPAVVQNE